MIKHPVTVIRLAAATTAVVALLALSVGPAAADTTPGGDASYSQNGSSADLYASSCTDNGNDTFTCVEQEVGIFAGKMTDSVSGVTHSSQVCAAVGTYIVDATTGDYVGDPVFERGCRVDLPSGAIRFGSRLSSASLAATHITLEQWICDEKDCVPGASRDVVVAAAWTGFGPISSGKYRSSGNDGTCRYSDWFKGSDRQADATATFDGQAIGSDESGGYLSSGRTGFKSACSEA